LIVQPRTIAKTQTIQRTVVLVHDPAKSGVTLLNEEAAGESSGDSTNDGNQLGESPKQAEYRAWWMPVLNMQFDDPDQEPPKLYYPNNVRTPLPFQKTWILGYRAGGDTGKIAVCTSGSGQSYSDMISKLADQREEILSELPEGSEFGKSTQGVFFFGTTKSASEFENEEAKRSWISETLNAYVNALRPRLKELA